MPLYWYKNKESNEVFQKLVRKIPKDPWEDIQLDSGEPCERVWGPQSSDIDKKSGKRSRCVKANPEPFEADPDYIRKVAQPGKTKITFQDGHKELYNPIRHR